MADKAVDVAITYIKKNNKLGVNADPVKVVGNRTDATGMLELRKYFQIFLNTLMLFTTLTIDE